MLRQKFEAAPGSLAVAQFGIAADWTFDATSWLLVVPRLMTGVSLYGWIDSSGTLTGGPTWMVRPEMLAYVKVFPFLALGGGVGYHLAFGSPVTGLSTREVLSISRTRQARMIWP